MKKSLTETILGNFVFINEENKSKEIQGKNVLSFTKFVLGGFLSEEVLAWGVYSGGGGLSEGICLGFFCPDAVYVQSCFENVHTIRSRDTVYDINLGLLC